VLFSLNKVLFRIRKTSTADQKKWKDDYNSGFLDFPGGMIDWFAFGVLLLLIFSGVTILLFIFDLETGVFKPKYRLAILFFVLAGLVYYVIYFKSLPWLKDKIRMVNKKYYL
jgi:hypothetical protein